MVTLWLIECWLPAILLFIMIWSNIGMKPIQLFPDKMDWIFGVDNEFSVYVKISEDVGRWIQIIRDIKIR